MKTLRKKDCEARFVTWWDCGETTRPAIEIRCKFDPAVRGNETTGALVDGFAKVIADYGFKDFRRVDTPSSSIAEAEPPEPAPEPDWRDRFPVGQRVRRVARYPGSGDDSFGAIGGYGVVKSVAGSCCVGGITPHLRPTLTAALTTHYADGKDTFLWEPVAYVPGDLVSHPEHGEGMVFPATSNGWVCVKWAKGGSISLESVIDGLTLIRRAPWSEVAQ